MENQVTPAPKGNRNYWIDLMRLVMALFVVGVHCTRQIGWGSDPNQGMAILNSTIFRTAVPFFFLITSYYVYDRYLASGKQASVFSRPVCVTLGCTLSGLFCILPIILRESWVGQGTSRAGLISAGSCRSSSSTRQSPSFGSCAPQPQWDYSFCRLLFL
jgi:hypothetical protein